MIFYPHTALKMCSNAGAGNAKLSINCASARIFALSEDKISSVQMPLSDQNK